MTLNEALVFLILGAILVGCIAGVVGVVIVIQKIAKEQIGKGLRL